MIQWCTVSEPNGRSIKQMGALPMAPGMKGEAYGIQLMKLETKCRRRAVEACWA